MAKRIWYSYRVSTMMTEETRRSKTDAILRAQYYANHGERARVTCVRHEKNGIAQPIAFIDYWREYNLSGSVLRCHVQR